MALRFLLVGMVSLGSCQSLFQTPVPPPREDLVPYHGAPARSGPPRRVVMLPFDSEAGHADYATALASQIQQAIAGRALFEVIPVADEDLEGIAIASSRRRGIYRTEDLIAISRRFGADGVVYGLLTGFRPYPSVAVGLRLSLLDCRTGEVPFATEVLLDAEDRRVDQDVRNWQGTERRASTSLVAHERVLISPRLFGRYTADRVAKAMEQVFRPFSQDADLKPLATTSLDP